MNASPDVKNLALDMEKHPEKDAGGANSVTSTEATAREEGIQPIFLAKVRVLNAALADCGMGRYQWKLFVSAGFGWFSDNIWLQSVAIVMPSVANELGWKGYPEVRLATLALYAGLVVGAAFWGMTCDVVGRRLAWNATILISAIFGIAAGAAPSFPVFGVMLAFIGFGAGGNLPVDGALFLEFLPGSHQHILTLLALWWAVGQVVASLVSWVFIARFSCDPDLLGTVGYVCFSTASGGGNNAGWRYAYYTLGALMLFLSAVRVFLLPMEESPKFLVSIGRDAEAVAVIHRVAAVNGKICTLTVEDLENAARPYYKNDGDGVQDATKFSTWGLIKNSFSDWDGEHVKGLFATPRLAYSCSLIIFIYGALGLAYPLYYAFLGSYLSFRQSEIGDNSVDATYSAYTYQAACGVVGSVLAMYMVQWKRGGRKWAMAFFTILTGIFLFGLTVAKTSVQINVLSCMASLCGNGFYSILYSYAPELFPTPHRGTGDALCAASSRITGLMAPIIAVYSAASANPNGPVFVSAAIFVLTGLTMLALPIETQGVTAL